jgi:hypothetical protein
MKNNSDLNQNKMKRSILALTAFVFIISLFFAGCSTPAENVANAQKNVNEANSDLNAANNEYLAEVAAYKKEAADKIAANEKSIAEFKARKESDKRDAQLEYENKINALEQKNSDMKKKMDEYQVEGKDKWETFKTDFGHGMDELGKAFTSIADSKSK